MDIRGKYKLIVLDWVFGPEVAHERQDQVSVGRGHHMLDQELIPGHPDLRVTRQIAGGERVPGRIQVEEAVEVDRKVGFDRQRQGAVDLSAHGLSRPLLGTLARELGGGPRQGHGLFLALKHLLDALKKLPCGVECQTVDDPPIAMLGHPFVRPLPGPAGAKPVAVGDNLRASTFQRPCHFQGVAVEEAEQLLPRCPDLLKVQRTDREQLSLLPRVADFEEVEFFQVFEEEQQRLTTPDELVHQPPKVVLPEGLAADLACPRSLRGSEGEPKDGAVKPALPSLKTGGTERLHEVRVQLHPFEGGCFCPYSMGRDARVHLRRQGGESCSWGKSLSALPTAAP